MDGLRHNQTIQPSWDLGGYREPKVTGKRSKVAVNVVQEDTYLRRGVVEFYKMAAQCSKIES